MQTLSNKLISHTFYNLVKKLKTRRTNLCNLRPIKESIMANKKSINKLKDEFFAACPHNFEEILMDEMSSIGIKELAKVVGGVNFKCSPEKAIELVLKSRVASRIYKKLYSFDIKNEKDIYFHAKEIKWKAVFTLDQTFKTEVSLGHSPDGTRRSKFTNTMYLGQVLKDGIVDYFRATHNDERPNVEKQNPHALISMRIQPHDNKFSSKEEVLISLDLSGEILSNRKYRIRSVEAPIRENLAAGLIIKAGLKKDEDFYDPMCGGGTFLIEALLIKAGITPSFKRIDSYFDEEEEFKDQWAFLEHEFYQKNKYIKENTEKLLTTLKKENEAGFAWLKKNNIKIYGTDNSTESIKVAKMNIQNAGMGNYIYLEVADGTSFKPGPFAGKIITNPPYGERIGEVEELEEVYYQLGENFKNNFKGSSAFLITGNKELLKKIRLKPAMKMDLRNGKLDSKFVQYDLF